MRPALKMLIKTADIIPTIKNHKLDPNDFKSYRPISNLSFLGKLTERVVLRSLNDHLTRNDLNVPEQSAYKKIHSTETILLKIGISQDLNDTIEIHGHMDLDQSMCT